jgi:hypothetical protein
MTQATAMSRFEVIFEAEGVKRSKFRNDVKVHLRGPHAVSYDLPTDEGGIHGGDASAPYPLAYFTSALTACVMTQTRVFQTPRYSSRRLFREDALPLASAATRKRAL